MILNVWRMGLRYVCMRWDRLGTHFPRFGRLFIIVNERFTFVSHSIMFLFYFLLVGRIPFWRFFCFVFFFVSISCISCSNFCKFSRKWDTTSDGYFFPKRSNYYILLEIPDLVLQSSMHKCVDNFLLFYKIFYFLFLQVPINDFPLSALILYLYLWFRSISYCVYR